MARGSGITVRYQLLSLTVLTVAKLALRSGCLLPSGCSRTRGSGVGTPFRCWGGLTVPGVGTSKSPPSSISSSVVNPLGPVSSSLCSPWLLTGDRREADTCLRDRARGRYMVCIEDANEGSGGIKRRQSEPRRVRCVRTFPGIIIIAIRI